MTVERTREAGPGSTPGESWHVDNATRLLQATQPQLGTSQDMSIIRPWSPEPRQAASREPAEFQLSHVWETQVDRPTNSGRWSPTAGAETPGHSEMAPLHHRDTPGTSLLFKHAS